MFCSRKLSRWLTDLPKWANQMSNGKAAVWCARCLRCLLAAETLDGSGRGSHSPCCRLRPLSHHQSLFLSHWPSIRCAVDRTRPGREIHVLSGFPLDRQKRGDLWMRHGSNRGPIGERNTWRARRAQEERRARSVRPQMGGHHHGIGRRLAPTIVAQTEADRDSGHQWPAGHRCQTFCILQADGRGLWRPRRRVSGLSALFRGGRPTGMSQMNWFRLQSNPGWRTPIR